MNKLVISALAATVCVGATNASEGDWTGLDAELSALSTSLVVKDGAAVGGYIETTYDADTEAWGIGRNRITLSGDNGGYGYNVSFDATDADALDDAYVTFSMFGMGWTMGTFRAPTTGNHLEAEADLHFLDRNALGGGGARTTGLMAGGDISGFGWAAHYDDGGDITLRVTYDVMSGDGINLSVAYGMDDGADASWMEANASQGPFGLSFTTGDGAGGDDDSCIVVSYDVNDSWNVALRSETDQDTASGDDETTIAATHTDGGARWTIQMDDDDEFSVGVLVGF